MADCANCQGQPRHRGQSNLESREVGRSLRRGFADVLTSSAKPSLGMSSIEPSPHGRDLRRPDEREFLDPPVDRLEGSDFGGVKVALRVNRQVVKSAELPWR